MAKAKKKVKKVVKKTDKKVQSKAAKTGYKRGSLSTALTDLFKAKGVDKVTFEEALKAAQKALPTTQFNKGHFSWYKNKYRVDH